MNKKISSGQIFTLMFVSRIFTLMTYMPFATELTWISLLGIAISSLYTSTNAYSSGNDFEENAR